jgi:chemotaxis protein MotD
MLDATAPVSDHARRKAAPSKPQAPVSAPSRPADATKAADQPPVSKVGEGTDSDTTASRETASGAHDLPDKAETATDAAIDAQVTQDDPPAVVVTPQAAQPEPVAAAVALPVAAATDTTAPAEGETTLPTSAPALPAVANAAPALDADAKPQAALKPEAKADKAGASKAADTNLALNPDLPFGADEGPQAKTEKADAAARIPGAPDKPQAEAADTASKSEPQKADPAQKPGATHTTTPQPDPANPPQHAMLASAAAQDASAPRAMTAQMTSQMPVPVSGLAVEIATQAKAGNSRFEIRLDPQELGRIDVRLDVDKDGNVKSRLIIERADTYDLLRRDASTLERALQQAGLKTSDHGLEFTLRDQGGMQRDAREHMPRNAQQAIIPDADILPEQAASGYSRLIGTGSGIDIRI